MTKVQKFGLIAHVVLALSFLVFSGGGDITNVLAVILFVSWGPFIAPHSLYYWYLPVLLLLIYSTTRIVKRPVTKNLIIFHIIWVCFWLPLIGSPLFGDYVGP